jgi:hypothetical protein
MDKGVVSANILLGPINRNTFGTPHIHHIHNMVILWKNPQIIIQTIEKEYLTSQREIIG